jgi:hypothetical protein
VSITVIQTIPDYSFVGSPMWEMISGSQNNLADFKYAYYVDTDVNLSGFTNKSLVLQQSRPSDGFGVYDPRLVLKDFIPHASGNLVLSEVGVNRDPSFLKYKLRAAEYSGSTLISAIADVKATGFALLGAVKTKDFPGFIAANYMTNSPTVGKYMTNSPRSLNIYSSQHQWLYIIQNAVASLMEVRTYNSTGGALGVYDIATPAYVNDKDRFMRISVGTYQLTATPSGSVAVISGTYPIITSGVSSYSVTIYGTLSNQLSEVFTYNIIDPNCKYTNVRLHFMNRFGRFDSFNFPLVSKNKMTNERKTYQPPLGQRTGATFGYGTADRGITQFFVRSKESIHIISDWLTNAEAAWIEELFNSPCVYMQTDSSTLVAMNVTGSSFDIKENENGELINYEIDIDYANPNEW